MRAVISIPGRFSTKLLSKVCPLCCHFVSRCSPFYYFLAVFMHLPWSQMMSVGSSSSSSFVFSYCVPSVSFMTFCRLRFASCRLLLLIFMILAALLLWFWCHTPSSLVQRFPPFALFLFFFCILFLIFTFFLDFIILFAVYEQSVVSPFAAQIYILLLSRAMRRVVRVLLPLLKTSMAFSARQSVTAVLIAYSQGFCQNWEPKHQTDNMFMSKYPPSLVFWELPQSLFVVL